MARCARAVRWQYKAVMAQTQPLPPGFTELIDTWAKAAAQHKTCPQTSTLTAQGPDGRFFLDIFRGDFGLLMGGCGASRS